MRVFARLIIGGALCCWAAFASSGWVVARSPHFEVYSQAGQDRATSALARFEELRAFFDRNGIIAHGSSLRRRPPVKVIGFSSTREYSAFRLRATADAYYTGTEDHDYIVLPALGPEELGVAAHEYAHFVLRSSGLTLPAWLNEGLAEVFSTVQFTSQRSEFGGAIPVHLDTLRSSPWLPISELLDVKSDSPLRQTRQGGKVFYAESWALTDLLVFSPEYAVHLGDLIAGINSGASSSDALKKIYGKGAPAILHDAQLWVDHARQPRRTLPSSAPEAFQSEITELPDFQAHALLAELLLANGENDRAEQMYRELLRQAPGDSNTLAALGTLALRKGDHAAAIDYWRKAIDAGQHDAGLCYRYAVLADATGIASDEIAPVLERAIMLRPDFDDARYRLAFLKSNAGEFDAAVALLRAMAKPSRDRAFAYWTVMSYALSELGKRDEADLAAQQAMQFAETAADRDRAAQLSYVAKTDLSVRFERAADGKLQLATTRVPHGSTDRNPFVEAGDDIQVVKGMLREVQCSAGKLTGFLVESNAAKVLVLSVPDPMHVLMRNSPAEFNCGPQVGSAVQVEYAKAANGDDGVLRGMAFQ